MKISTYLLDIDKVDILSKDSGINENKSSMSQVALLKSTFSNQELKFIKSLTHDVQISVNIWTPNVDIHMVNLCLSVFSS